MTELTQKIYQKSILFKSILLSFSTFTFSWLLTFLFVRLIWGGQLAPLNPLILVVDFLLALGMILVLVIFVRSKESRFKVISLFFVVLFIFALINIFVLNSKIMNYGDKGSLSAILGDNKIFPRWMLGTGLLEFFMARILSPIVGNVNELIFVKVMSAVVMCVTSILLIIKNHKKTGVLLALTTPIWLIFTTGYDEYYPFIGSLFIFFLLLISGKWLLKIHPLMIGGIAAAIGLFYAGFVPLSLFLLVIYTLHRGVKKGIVAALVALLTAFLLVLLFYGKNFVHFPGEYASTLNIRGAEEVKGIYIEHTPFYTLQYAFSGENFKRVFTQFFWTGSFPYLLIILGGLSPFFKRILHQTGKLAFWSMGLFLLFQLFYFILMIPYLGVVIDIDLFFSVYLTAAFMSGWLIDSVIADYQDDKKSMIRIAAFSFCTGSSAVVLIYFMFLGLFAIA